MNDIVELNGLQQMMLRWEEFHPLNAIHVVELGQNYGVSEVQEAVSQVCDSLGLRPVQFDRRKTSADYNFDNLVEPHPPFAHLRFERPTECGIEDYVNSQLNLPFGRDVHWPLRFCLLQSANEKQFLIVTYQHAISDSRGISIILRELIRYLAKLSARITHLNLSPKPLHKHFTKQLGWSTWPQRHWNLVQQLHTATNFYHPPRRRSFPRRIESGMPMRCGSTDQLRKAARHLGVKVHALVSAALIEALGLHFLERIRTGRRRLVSIYSPVDLRGEADGAFDNALGQLLGGMTSHAAAKEGCPFQNIVKEVCRQQSSMKRIGHHYSHTSQMSFMARLWDHLPRRANEIAAPCLVPQAGFVSNVNLTNFLNEEREKGLIRNYSRFSGTGIMSPMMLGVTTLGPSYLLTSTHHTDVFNSEELRRILTHVQWRLEGHTSEPTSHKRFLSHVIHPHQLLSHTKRLTRHLSEAADDHLSIVAPGKF